MSVRQERRPKIHQVKYIHMHTHKTISVYLLGVLNIFFFKLFQEIIYKNT